MQSLLILTLSLIAGAFVAAMIYWRQRNSPTQEESSSAPPEAEAFTVYSVGVLSTIAAVITAAVIPMVAIFHSAEEPALIALLVFFLLPVLAYAFLARCHYLPREKPTLKPPARHNARR